MVRAAWVALLLAACDTDAGKDDVDVGDEVGDDDTDTDTDDGVSDTDELTETDAVDTDAVDTDVVDTDTRPPVYWHHVVETIAVLPQAQGFDVDGDGTIDNQIGALDDTINGLISANYGLLPIYAVTQVWGLDDGDDQVDVGVFAVRDADQDPSDNFTGNDEMRAYDGMDPLTGHALNYGVGTLDPAGDYEARLGAGLLQIGPIAIPVATDIQLSGNVTEARHEGRLGGAVARDDLLVILDLAGLGSFGFLVNNLLDVDTDNDGEPDAISAAFEFTAVKVTVRP